jgi:hypothetical protein
MSRKYEDKTDEWLAKEAQLCEAGMALSIGQGNFMMAAASKLMLDELKEEQSIRAAKH